jgi:hypothetical protein
MTEYELQLEQKKSRVLVENNAQAIFDHLAEFANLGGVHERRWLWELLQNAKDSVEGTQTLSVEVQIQDNQLVFRHSGTPFTDDEVIHLIYHGSTKKGSVDKTGKFGTGFLTTHLLSKRVLVSGILSDGRPFNFNLDRGGKNAKEVEAAMECSWDEFKNCRSTSTEAGFTTTYKYTLDDQTKLIAHKGLNDLPRLLPFVPAFNAKFGSFTLKTVDATTTFRRASNENLSRDRIFIQSIQMSNGVVEAPGQTLALAVENGTAVAIPILVSNESITRMS